MSSSALVITDPLEAVRRLRAGGLVALPTETVYGLAADTSNRAAIERVYEIKSRPRDHPLIVHIADASRLPLWAKHISPAATHLAATCWPGPLTVLVERSVRVDDAITGGRDTVGVRVPAHHLTTRVLTELEAVVAPSANLFGRVSPTTAAHVLNDLGELLDPARDAILDGGPCEVGVESTIVDCTVEPCQILRPGAITADDIERILGSMVGRTSGPSRASGMLESHYAPRHRVVVIESDDDPARFGTSVTVIDRCDDVVAYARDLYDLLRRADDSGSDLIVAVLPPPQGLGYAVRDRLFKAAGPRATTSPEC